MFILMVSVYFSVNAINFNVNVNDINLNDNVITDRGNICVSKVSEDKIMLFGVDGSLELGYCTFL